MYIHSKHIVLFFFTFLPLVNTFAQTQKIGFFESDVILSYIPEYLGTEQRLQLLSEGWKQELSDIEAEIKILEDDYIAKEILYTLEIREQKQKKIQQKKDLRSTFLNQKFGPEGEYFQSQEELLEPIYRQISIAFNEVAKKQRFDYVFYRSGEIYLIYARNEWNLNELILIELGIDIDE